MYIYIIIYNYIVIYTYMNDTSSYFIHIYIFVAPRPENMLRRLEVCRNDVIYTIWLVQTFHMCIHTIYCMYI